MRRRILLIVVIIFCFFCWCVYQKGNAFVSREFGVTVPDITLSLFDGNELVKSENGRTNILLLGIGGGNHEGATLTDTIIVSSLSLSSSPSAVLVSIPRDLWSNVLQDRINSAYYYGEERKTGNGLAYAKNIIETEIGVPIQYAMLLDFSRFKEIIDAMGGVTVTIPQSFVDEAYPIPGKETDECSGNLTFSCRYQTVEFRKGEEKMYGDRALVYVRSRHSEGEFGNDFSRGKRQQDILIAIKDKLFDQRVWSNPKMLARLFQVFRETITTDMSIPELIAIGKPIMGKMSLMSIEQVTLEPELQVGSIDIYGRFALIPIDSYERFFSFIRSKIWHARP